MKQLTDKQKDLLLCLENNPDSTYDELAQYLGWAGRGNVGERMKALEKKGYIQIIPHQIKILKTLDTL